MADTGRFQFSVNFLPQYCFLCAWHTGVLLILQSVLCTISTLGCLWAWEFPLHFLVSELTLSSQL